MCEPHAVAIDVDDAQKFSPLQLTQDVAANRSLQHINRWGCKRRGGQKHFVHVAVQAPQTSPDELPQCFRKARRRAQRAPVSEHPYELEREEGIASGHFMDT